MTEFADAAGAALLRAVDDLAAGRGIPPDAPELDRVRALARTLRFACSYFESGEPAASFASTSPRSDPSSVPAGPSLDDYRRIAAVGGDAILVARLLHSADVDLIERLKVLRTVFDLPLAEARTIDDLARDRAG
ncbi:hypothetical protein ACQPW3_26450 [Actinosynnema sp. CA-248983]